MDDDWISDEDLDHLRLEEAVHGDETPAQRVQRIFDENAVFAAKSIVELSRDSASDRVRLDASKYVVERVVGKLGDEPSAADPWEGLFSNPEIVKEA